MSLTFHSVHLGEQSSVETRLLFRFPFCLPSSPLSGSYHGLTPFTDYMITTYYNLYNTTFVKVCKYYNTKYLFVKSLYSFGTLVIHLPSLPVVEGGECLPLFRHCPPLGLLRFAHNDRQKKLAMTHPLAIAHHSPSRHCRAHTLSSLRGALPLLDSPLKLLGQGSQEISVELCLLEPVQYPLGSFSKVNRVGGNHRYHTPQ